MNARFTNSFVKSSFLVAAVALALIGCGGSGASTNGIATKLAASYTVELVEAPAGGSGLQFTHISPNGTIGGEYYNGANTICFAFKNGVLTDKTPAGQDSEVVSVSDSGDLEGNYEEANSQYPYSTAGSGYHDKTKPGNYSEGWSNGRDDSGRTYLGFTNSNSEQESYREKDGVYTPLTATGGTNVVITASSPAGYATGYALFNGVDNRIIFTPSSNVGTKILEDLPGCSALAINDLGTVGGYVNEGGGMYSAFVNVGGQTYKLPGLGGNYSQISAINAGNVAVGASNPASLNGYMAIGWSITDGQVDLNTRISNPDGFTAYVAKGIDKAGHIVGWGYKNATMVGFILTPVTP